MQCSIWVFPGAEHSRFMHSLGSMHVASKFAKQVYNSLKKIIANLPPLAYIEETLRLAALLHDIGHGPFGHCFDHHYLLEKYGITHEDIGQKIITSKLNKIIKNIHRSPSGNFEKDIIPEYLAYLIKKPSGQDGRRKYPKWLQLLRPLFSGPFTVDNLDYVMRDSLMCGISTEPIDLERIIYYTAIYKEGLVLHKSGVGALTRFLETKIFLYIRIYFHRTVRSFELHLSEILKKTIESIFTSDPKDKDFLDKYLHLTDLSLLGKVSDWIEKKKAGVKTKKRIEEKLIREWEMLLRRRKKWRFICGTGEAVKQLLRLHRPYNSIDIKKLEEKIRKATKIPSSIKIKIDMTSLDTRPISPFAEKGARMLIYDPSKNKIESQALEQYLNSFPFKTAKCFLFINQRQKKYDEKLIQAFERNIGPVEEEPTNT